MASKVHSTRTRLASACAAQTSSASPGMENSDGVDQNVDNDDKVGDSGKEGETADFDTDDCDGKTRGWSPGGKKQKNQVCMQRGIQALWTENHYQGVQY